MYICRNEKYCSDVEEYKTLKEFLQMCQECFGSAPKLEPRELGDELWEEDGSEPVLIKVQEVRILEQGNGFPKVGDYLSGDTSPHRIENIFSFIHTDNMFGNYVFGHVREFTWDECEGKEFFPAGMI
jgi:hypothetical protein